MTDVKQIAAPLSEAMLTALQRLDANYCWADGRSVRALVRRGLAGFVGPDPVLGTLAFITPEGRAAVRRALMQENDDGE